MRSGGSAGRPVRGAWLPPPELDRLLPALPEATRARMQAAFIDGHIGPAAARIVTYCLMYRYIAPRYLPARELPALAGRIDVTLHWLRRKLRRLVAEGILLRDRPGRRAGYALNPAWDGDGDADAAGDEEEEEA